MVPLFTLRGIRAAIVAACVIVSAGVSAQAEELLASRLGALLGQERQSLEIVPSAVLSALTAPPRAGAPVVDPNGLNYSADFLAAQPVASGGDQWECLTQALYFEARGESVAGIFAVGEVILNRVDSGRFPASVCSVVNQGTGRQHACQFSFTCDGRSEAINEPAAWNEVGKVARLLLDGAPRELTNGATYYHTRVVNPRWSRTFDRTAEIGSHYFYRENTVTASN